MKFKLITLCAFVAALTVGCKGDEPEPEPTPPDKVTGLYINEVYSNDPDWIELYNSNDNPIELKGFVLQNNKGAAEEYVIPEGVSIAAKGFLVFNRTVQFGFDISSGGDNVKLFDTAGQSVSEIVIPVIEGNRSYGRTVDGGATWLPFESPTKGISNTAEPPPTAADNVVINEVYSRGKGETNPDEVDWVELFNWSDKAVDVGGLILSDKEDQLEKVTIPIGTTIVAKGFLVVDVDIEGGFGLSSGGDRVWLFDATGTQIDYTEFGPMEDIHSWSAFPDGTDNFRIQTTTKGVSNDSGTPPPAADYTGVLINEVYSRGKGSVDPGVDWVELHNASDNDLDIGGLILSDKEDMLEKVTIPAGTTIAAKGFLVVDVDIVGGFGLSSGGDQVWLFDPAGTQLDYTLFGAMDESQSWSAFPDGSGNFRMQAITKGLSNNSVEVDDYTGLVINEVDGNGKFVELYNNGGKEISLVGVRLLKVTDREESWWTGGATAVIPAKGFYTIAQAGGATGANEYTGNGGISPKKNVKFTLTKPDGVTELDAFTRSVGLAPDAGCTPDYGSGTKYSFSRCPDGSGTFGLSVPSCGAANPFVSAGAIVTNEATTQLTIAINEVDGNGKFVEIINTGGATVSLKDVRLVKNLKDVWWTGTTQTIAPGGYFTIAQAGGAAEADEHTGNGGISPKKTVRFDMVSGNMSIDVFARVKADNVLDVNCTPDYATGPYSFSRTPGGTGAFSLATPTCGAANGASAGAIVTE